MPSCSLPSLAPSYCFLPLPPTPVLTPPPLPPRVFNSSNLQTSVDNLNLSEKNINLIKISPDISPISSIGWKFENNNNIKLTNMLNLSSLSLDKQKADGEKICFSGWVYLFLTTATKDSNAYNKKDDSIKKRCWALIQKNQLIFMENDEVIFFN